MCLRFFFLISPIMTTAPAQKSFWKQQAKDLLLIFVVSLPTSYLSCSSCFSDINKVMILIPVNFVIWVLLWKGNEVTVDVMNRMYSWLEQPVKRLIGGILAHTAYTALAVYCVFYMFLAFGIDLGDVNTTLRFSIGATFLISLVLHSISFLRSWRTMAIESERMKKDVAIARYESLKNQVNPHFLFNSLNALSNLVYEDADQANKFIQKLSEVYRYVLESKDKDLVPLETEMKFVQSYLYLQKIRFGESLKITEAISGESNYQLPPLSVQMLLENAIKHNVVSQDDPLEVRLYMEEDYLVVENNLQKKNILPHEISEVGLSNIRARYAVFTDAPVKIQEEDGKFLVALPLLKK
jgi:hypothetical protein